MMKWSIYICCFFLISCNSNKQLPIESPSNEMTSIDKEAKERFGENYFIVNNANNTYSLVKSKTKKFSEIGFDITYFIIDNQSNEIIIEDFLKSGYVNWVDENSIKAVNRKIGNDNTREKIVYVYNVETKEKTEL